ncbi:DUF4383 domain-containing protein [Mycobacterium sp. M26]|uniref:DUF4383 domain-containing protein n=1 Tax=Mycobacterium sp. M26 TaxID=1762962 RepID=UPI00073F62B8|nr:DUF4383 domain-containing protein [Mycobacterium sp. M26]
MATAKSSRLRRPVGLLAVQGAAVLVAAAFLAVAIAGFTPGLTTRLDQLQWFGPDSRAQLFGVFNTSVVHNLVHLVAGMAGLLLATSYGKARAYLILGGLLFLSLWLYGLLSDPKVLPLNNADNWLHFSIGVVMVLLGVTLAGARVPTGAGGEPLIDD